MANSLANFSNDLFIPGLGPRLATKDEPVPAHLRQLIHRLDDRQKFWMNNKNWPEDAYGKVFLANAVVRLGAAMFPREWTGHEPSVNMDLEPLPLLSSQARPGQVRQALDAVPNVDREPLLERLGRPEYIVNQRDWDKAVDLRNLVLADLERPRARFRDAKFALREAMKADNPDRIAVKFHTLDVNTGDFSPALPHTWWNTTDYWEARFYWCRLNPKEPITPVVGGNLFKPIFVDGSDLASLVAAAAPRTEAKKRGPKPKDDAALVEKMKALLDSDHPPNSLWEAAKVIAEENPETNVLAASTQKRIFDAFNVKYPGVKRNYYVDGGSQSRD